METTQDGLIFWSSSMNFILLAGICGTWEVTRARQKKPELPKPPKSCKRAPEDVVAAARAAEGVLGARPAPALRSRARPGGAASAASRSSSGGAAAVAAAPPRRRHRPGPRPVPRPMPRPMPRPRPRPPGRPPPLGDSPAPRAKKVPAGWSSASGWAQRGGGAAPRPAPGAGAGPGRSSRGRGEETRREAKNVAGARFFCPHGTGGMCRRRRRRSGPQGGVRSRKCSRRSRRRRRRPRR